MRKLRIVSDSSSDILELKNVDFAYAPMKIITAEREFTDDSHLDVVEMANFFNMYKGRSQTSCPNVTDWIDAFGDAEDRSFCHIANSLLINRYRIFILAPSVSIFFLRLTIFFNRLINQLTCILVSFFSCFVNRCFLCCHSTVDNIFI